MAQKRLQHLTQRREQTILTLFAPFFGQGGVERMLVNLAAGLQAQGVPIHFLTTPGESPYLSLLPANVIRLIRGSKPKEIARELANYLNRENPFWVLTAKDIANKIAIKGFEISDTTARMAFRIGTTISVKQQESSSFFLKRILRLQQLRRLYRKCDLLIAVSEGAAEDLRKLMKGSRIPIVTIHNPVVSRRMLALAREPVGHRWFEKKECPVILGAGGFRRSKDFPTLVRAFALVRKKMPCRLVILGQGRQEEAIRKTARSLGVADDLDLPGFISNPYPYMAGADVFVLSSRWEGSPNVITEALALGTPVVSTDCKSGPREILADGAYGPLVPVGDYSGLARAIIDTLLSPPDRDKLRKASEPFTVEKSVQEYMSALRLEQND